MPLYSSAILELETTISASEFSCSFLIPSEALESLLLSSKSKGWIAIAIVKDFRVLATFAKICEAPVPVAPPIPARINSK